jgi:amino acid adenylation domain-containing protein
MNLRALCEDLEGRGVQLWAEGDRLRFRAPQGILTAELLGTLQQHKAEILRLLGDGLPRTLHADGPDAPAAYPLSYGQQALWFLYLAAPESPAYNIAFTTRIRSKLDSRAVVRTFQALVARHPSLRTTFSMDGDMPVQIVCPDQELCFEAIDASGWSEEELLARVTEAYRRPFDLKRGPVLRVTIFSRSEQDHVLLLAVHHIVCDGWSLWVLQDEFRALYAQEIAGGRPLLPPLDRTYADFVRWQQEMLSSPTGEQHWAYWRDQLAGELPVLQLPVDRARPPTRNLRGASEPFHVPPELTRRLRDTARAEGVTLYVVLLAAFQTLLHRCSRQEEILVGAATAGREQTQFAGVVGYFVNPVVLRTDLSGDPAFRQLLGRARETVLAALAHQDFPFPLLVERLRPVRDAAHSPLFQAMLTLQRPQRPSAMAELLSGGAKGARVDFEGMTLESFEMPQEEGQFDLSMELVETKDSLSGVLKYNTDLFEPATAARMAGHFRNLLEAATEDPGRRLSALTMLGPAERRQLLVKWSTTGAGSPPDVCVQQQFEVQAERTPDALAVACGPRQLSYRDLNEQANQLAHALRRWGVGPEVCVAVCTRRSCEMVVGLLAILKAGGAYVPLDPECPRERLRFLLDDCQAPVLLADRQTRPRVAEYSGRLVCVDDVGELAAGESLDNPPLVTHARNLAYVIYTSGSTGQPKGVEIEHAGLANLIAWHHAEYRLTRADRATHLANPSFDASVWELWPYLTAGASIHMPEDAARPGASQLVAWLASQRITLCFLPTPLAQVVIDLPWPDATALRALLTGGDRLQQGPRRPLPFELINHYGPTENSVVTTSGRVAPAAALAGPPPIGRPIAGVQVYVLDGHLQPVPVGVPGELCIGGSGLARGYHNRPELTAEKFIVHPFGRRPGERLYRSGDLVRWLPDGNLEFLGRLDHQVKIRGFRVELGEIEAVIRQNRDVLDVAVVARERRGESRLAAYVVPRDGSSPSIEGLRDFAREKVPQFMVPSVFVFLESLPLTPSGKVDRAALPMAGDERSQSAAPYVAPRTRTETLLAGIWAEVLGLDDVGIHDNFFDLGGASITSLRVVAKAEEAGLVLGPELLTPELLFEHPTIAELAALWDRAAMPDPSPGPDTLDQATFPGRTESSGPIGQAEEAQTDLLIATY